MVAFKATENTRWTLRKAEDVIKFYGEGTVVITRNGNLKIGGITMQRKGGDGGRETAKMLQFKINPAKLFDTK
jgi:dissimilatory sulfite reductase (desulfoviridin) alpha/beta subunit